MTVVTLRPDADVDVGGWTNELSGTTLYSSVNEETPNDTTFIQSSDDPVDDVCLLSLSDPAHPITLPCTVNVRFKKTGPSAVDLRVRLLEGTTEIITQKFFNIDSDYIDVSLDLSAMTIVDPTNLFIEFTAGAWSPFKLDFSNPDNSMYIPLLGG